MGRDPNNVQLTRVDSPSHGMELTSTTATGAQVRQATHTFLRAPSPGAAPTLPVVCAPFPPAQICASFRTLAHGEWHPVRHLGVCVCVRACACRVKSVATYCTHAHPMCKCRCGCASPRKHVTGAQRRRVRRTETTRKPRLDSASTLYINDNAPVLELAAIVVLVRSYACESERGKS